MSKDTTKTTPALTAPPPPPPPAYNAADARPASPAPYRHEPTARTVAYEQPTEDGKRIHLFTATFAFIDTVAGLPTADDGARENTTSNQ